MITIELTHGELMKLLSMTWRSLEHVEKAIIDVDDREELEFLCDVQQELSVLHGKLGGVNWFPRGGR